MEQTKKFGTLIDLGRSLLDDLLEHLVVEFMILSLVLTILVVLHEALFEDI